MGFVSGSQTGLAALLRRMRQLEFDLVEARAQLHMARDWPSPPGPAQMNSILFYSILFYSILFYSILFYSILFYSILFYSILFYSIRVYYFRIV